MNDQVFLDASISKKPFPVKNFMVKVALEWNLTGGWVHFYKPLIQK